MEDYPNFPISIAPDTVGIGVDFGMTYSGAGISQRARDAELPNIKIVPARNQWSNRKIASKVYVNGQDHVAVAGNRALTKFLLDNSGTGHIYELFKRELVSDDESPDILRPDTTPSILTREVIAEVLRDVDASLAKNGWVNAKRQFAFSYPSSWTPSQQSRLRNAAEEVTQTHIQLIDEPLSTAIAVAHLFEKHRRALQFGRSNVFVCDIGGGTLDFAAVEVNPTGLVRVVGPTFGAARLGMSNMDKVLGLLLYESSTVESPEVARVLYNNIVMGPELNDAWRSLNLTAAQQYELLEKAEMLKIFTCEHWDQEIQFPAKTLSGRGVQIPKTLLEPIYSAMVDEICSNIQLYFRQLEDARFAVSADYFDFVIVSGGGSALPGVHDALRALFPRAKVPQIPISEAATLVQRGTAWYALQPQIVEQRRHSISFGIAALTTPTHLATNREFEVVTLDDGKIYEVGYRRFIRRGDLLTSESTRLDFTVGRDNQPSVIVAVYEGEHERLSDNRLVRNVTVTLPDGARRDDTYQIVIRLHDDGMLHVRVKEASNEGWLPGEIQLNWS